ncbi:GntR family transcriptional regulator [Streptomyces sp. NPDC102340]|uniref:GntR family transcriptional regulator n=1 Tax=unclassified Streptomyces TaxID=2593676 RepID=UPI0038039B27
MRRALADGALNPGARLPAAREVARLLDVNVHTILRVYQQSRDEHLIDLRHGRGAVVIAVPAQARLREVTSPGRTGRTASTPKQHQPPICP